MATKTEKKAPKTEGKAKRVTAPRRPAEDMLSYYEQKRAKLVESTNAALANYDRLIASAKARLSPETAVVEVLAQGHTPESIEAMERQLRKAKAALKGKTPEQIAALQEQAAQLKASQEPEVSEAGEASVEA